MDFFDTPAILILGFVKNGTRATLQDYNHGKVVSSQSINLGQSSFMTVYADLVALLRWRSASVRPPLPERDTASVALSTQHRPILNPGTPCNCMSLAATFQSQHDRMDLTVAALFYLTYSCRAASGLQLFAKQCGAVGYSYRLLVGQHPPHDNNKCSMCARYHRE